MTCDLESTEPPRPLYRLGRRGAVWAWPDGAYAGEDGTFGHRYDDTDGQYRVMYASSQRLGTFLETLARFRPDPAILAEPIEGDPADRPHPTSQPGTVPASWLTRRAIGTAGVAGDFADIGHSRSLQHLRTELAARLIHHGLVDLDGATIRITAPRRFTKMCPATSTSAAARPMPGSGTCRVSATRSTTGRSSSLRTSPNRQRSTSPPTTRTSRWHWPDSSSGCRPAMARRGD